MWIKKLVIHNCRSLIDVTISLSPDINLIVGENASGKTSLLEALNILSCGRSFRTSHISDVITDSKDSLLISAIVIKDNINASIGIEKSNKKTKIRINRKDIFSQSELSFFLPVTSIHPDSVDLITGSSIYRRSFLDRIVFYSFSSFYRLWKEYRHILKQRNICLKHREHRYALEEWTNKLVEIQPAINELRVQTLSLLTPLLNTISKSLFNHAIVNIELSTGFPNNLIINKKNILEFYKSKEEYDIKTKRTNYGIHKSDLSIQLNSSSAKGNASRGQQKLLAISLLLAQNSLINNENDKGILLIDDLAAELDKKNKEKLLSYLSSLKQQIIITSTKEFKIHNSSFEMFHVKQGEVSNYIS